MLGSVRGVSGDRHSYRDRLAFYGVSTAGKCSSFPGTRFYCIYSRLDTRRGENHGYQEEVSQKSFKAQGRQETESNGKEKTGEEAPCCEKENRSKEVLLERSVLGLLPDDVVVFLEGRRFTCYEVENKHCSCDCCNEHKIISLYTSPDYTEQRERNQYNKGQR